LVVDDTPQNVKLLVEILKAQKYHVVTAMVGQRDCRRSRRMPRI